MKDNGYHTATEQDSVQDAYYAVIWGMNNGESNWEFEFDTNDKARTFKGFFKSITRRSIKAERHTNTVKVKYIGKLKTEE